MKAKRLYALAAVNTAGEPFYQKMLMALLILALMLASLPVASAFAAPESRRRPENFGNLEKDWKIKLEQLPAEGLFYNQVRFYPSDFEDADDLAQAWDLLHQHGAALRQANTIVFNHAGFDSEGKVTNEWQAYKSVQDLGEALRLMRVARQKIADAGYKVQKVTTTQQQ
jgi:hypothetical protein